MPFRCGDWILSRPWPRVICRAGLLEAPGRFFRKNVKSCEKAGLKGGRRLIGERVQPGTSLSFGKLPNDVCSVAHSTWPTGRSGGCMTLTAFGRHR